MTSSKLATTASRKAYLGPPKPPQRQSYIDYSLIFIMLSGVYSVLSKLLDDANDPSVANYSSEMDTNHSLHMEFRHALYNAASTIGFLNLFFTANTSTIFNHLDKNSSAFGKMTVGTHSNVLNQTKEAFLLSDSQLWVVVHWKLVVKISVLLLCLYFGIKLFLRPLNRIRMLGDLGYLPENGLTMKEMANVVRKRRLAGDVPPVYPNGWFVVLETLDLKIGESKSVSCLGLQLAVFRGSDGRAHIIDAYCPHMGANLAIGGQVKGNCIECPFHGWKFNGDDGKCTDIPYSDAKIPDNAKVKSYHCLERNGFIHIWFHAEGAEPYWEPPLIEEILSGEWTFRGRAEHALNAHIEEVPENGADVAHLQQLHSPVIASGIDLRYTYSKLWSFLKHIWRGSWNQCTGDNEKHIGVLSLSHTLSIFGKEVSVFDLNVQAKQIGPGIVYLTFNSPTGKGAFLHSLTPTEPLVQRAIFHVYNHWACPTILGKTYLIGEAIQFERDISIWNNKRYNGKPLFVKSDEDALIAKHRRWYSQFYTEHSPRLKLTKDTLEW